MIKGVDCAAPLSFAKASKLRELGYAFAGRYLVPATASMKWKALTEAEARDITRAGLRLLCVWETSASRARCGAEAGGIDGRWALDRAREIGMPEKGIIYFAVDYDAQDADFPAIESYLRAAGQAIRPYKAGVYGGYRTIDAMYFRSACAGFWQCVAWSGGKLHLARDVYQREWSGGPEAKSVAARVGVSVDIDECEDMDRAGIWTYPEYEQEEESAVAFDVDKLSPEECWAIVKKGMDYAGGLPVSGWAKEKFARAKREGITDGSSPRAPISREEAAIMALRVKDPGERLKPSEQQ